MSISDVRVEFAGHWRALAPGLKLTAPSPWPEPAVEDVLPAVPWAVAYDGVDFRVTVGAVPLSGGAMSDALTTMNRLRASAGLAMAPAVAGSTSVRLLLTRPPSPAVCETLREVVTPPLAHLLGEQVASRLVARVDRDGIALDIAQTFVPDVLTRAMPLLAGLGAVVTIEAPDGLLPRGGVERLLLSARELLAGTVSRGDLDTLGDFGSVSRVTVAPPQNEYGPLQIAAFRSNARPIDEVEQPGSGCTESLALVSSSHRQEKDMLWVVFRLNQSDDAGPASALDVRLSAAFLPALGSPLTTSVPVPGLNDVAVQARRITASQHPWPGLEPTDFVRGDSTAYVAEIDVQRDLLPGATDSGWTWDQAEPALRRATPDGEDPFTFAHQFKQRLKVELVLNSSGGRAARRSTEIDIFDIDRFGTLYDRLITELVSVDTHRQAAARGLRKVYHAYHPWYPVLAIGLAKAKLYMRAVQEDTYWQRRNLADPSWLMRVGLYLEFLTCLGIVEAVKKDFPDLLTTSERRIFEESPAFEEIRRRIDPHAWSEVWNQRGIVFAGNPVTAAGPVDFRNLFQKETANLAFLDAHHADLKHAVELAGPNLDSAQQTWHAVFRAAERAVLNASHTVFPEFRHLGATYQHFVLWHERGKFSGGGGLIPPWLTAAIGDRDGVYPTAARRYRESMNEVADWAKQRGLMDYAGDECVPRSASLIESQLEGENERYFALQILDGFRDPLQSAREYDDGAAAGAEIVVGMLRSVEIFEPLTVSEIWQLAHQAERRGFEPGENILVQDDPPTSLSIIEHGTVEVLVRQEDGTVLAVDRMDVGDIFGEYALLTGQPVSATIRAVDNVIVHQIPKSALQPIIEARPELVVELCVMLAERRVNRRTKSDRYLFGSSVPSDTGTMGRLVSRVRDYLLH